MLASRSAARLPSGIAPRNLPVLPLWPILLAVALLPSSGVATAQADANACARCHADLVRNFAESSHGNSTAAHADAAAACESCHGNGDAHVSSNGDTTKILNPPGVSPAEADARCLACHASRHPNYSQSAHATAGISCVNCHSLHAAKEGKLLKTSQPALCYKCHAGVAPQFAEPVHHQADKGSIKCTACHDPHAVFATQLQASINQQVAACLKCHTDLAGPWVYEHRAVKQAGCVACHTPHGGKNPKLLTQANVNTICLQCHLPSATVSDAQVNAAHTLASTRPCTSCHVAIHGSNHEDRFTNP